MLDINGMGWVNPSKISPWSGGREDRFTTAQEAQLKQLGPNVHRRRRAAGNPPAQFVVRVPLENARPGQASQTMPVLCPVLSWTRDRKKILVIAPSGDHKWVNFQ